VTVGISVCIVTGRRAPLLDACLASLQAQVDAPAFEVLVISDGDPAVAAAVRTRFPQARVALIKRALPGAARNWLIAEAHGDLLLFLDDDVVVGPNLLARLARVAAEHSEAGVFGGPNETPPGSTLFQTVQGAVLASIVGSGPVRRRYGQHPAGPADERFFTLCNLAVRREVMVPFRKDLVCAEENGALAELADSGVLMFYDPTLVAYHERRSTYRGFARQMMKYGRGRGELILRNPRTLRPAYLVPSGLLAYLAVAPFASLVTPYALLPLALYLSAVAAGAVKVATTLRRPLTAPLAAGLIFTLHVQYGAGVVRGVIGRRTRADDHEPEWVPVEPERADL
jgi:glycosyltransferase involved in cell wall biosynthesis